MTRDAEKERKEIGKRLVQYRESKGYDKQGDFLREILNKVKDGITQGNLSHWETGKFKPEYEKLLLIKQVFPDFNPDFILYGTTSTEATDEPGLAAKWKRLAEFYKRRADKYAEILAEKGIDIE